MEQDVCEVMSACLQAKQLAIEHVRESGQRMPVPRVRVNEGVDYTVERETARNQWIVIHVNVVV